MIDLEKINQVNRVVLNFFQENKDTTNTAAKDLMPAFIEAGVFKSNHRDGLPIRNLLRELDEKNALHLTPMLRAVRKAKNKNWYFTAARHLEI